MCGNPRLRVIDRDFRAESCRWISMQTVHTIAPKCAISQTMQSPRSINN